MNILINIKNLLLSPRFMSFYWSSGLMFLTGFIALWQNSLSSIGLPEMATVVIGLILAQLSKAVSNIEKGKPMGFSAKKFAL